MNLRHLTVASVAMTSLWFPVTGRTQGTTNTHWTVPKNPDPQAILYEAEADTRAGRYEDSLAKHVWYHENALKIQPAEYGVRLSFALADWVKLGKSYPPALEKLKSIRDNDDKTIRKDPSTRGLFHDFESINEYLEENNRTKDTFIWLDTNAPPLAREVFDIAEPALIKAKEYHLCGKYLDPNASFQRMLKLYQEQTQKETEKIVGDFAHEKFSNDSRTLVALLVANGRTNEANQIATKAEKVLDNPEFKSLLEKAKKGEIPEPWP